MKRTPILAFTLALLIGGCAASPTVTPGASTDTEPGAPSFPPKPTPSANSSTDSPTDPPSMAANKCPDGVELELPQSIQQVVEEYSGEAATCISLRQSSEPLAIFATHGSRAFAAWEAIRDAREPSYRPVIFGDAFSLDGLLGLAGDPDLDPKDVMTKAAAVDYDSWLQSRSEEVVEEFGEMPEDASRLEPKSWGPPEANLTAMHDILTGEYLPKVYLGVVPVESSAEVAAYFLYGGWNDSPVPEAHVAVIQEWTQRYDAEMVSIGEVMEFVVGRPPADWDSAMSFARAQFLYDYDIVYQGTGLINVLAQELENARTWYFWWD